jgi:hypothetical protein
LGVYVDDFTSPRVVATEWTREMLCSLRMMQRAEAGMPNAAAIVIRVAVDEIREEKTKWFEAHKYRTTLVPY